MSWSYEGTREVIAEISEMNREREAAMSKTAFWDKLVPCKDKLYNYIRKSLNFSADADDVFQETVLHAFQYIRSYNEDSDFGAWLFGIAHNEIKKHYKKIPKTAVPIELERLSSTDTSHTRHLVGDVYRYAERLNSRQREVFFCSMTAVSRWPRSRSARSGSSKRPIR